MSLGPFITYVPPGVYDRTLTQANVANIVAGLRLPFVIGVGQETLEQDNLELVRGSSALIDQQIVNEDVSLQWVVNSTNPNNLILGAQTGQLYQFVVRNLPITDGTGIGRVTNYPSTILVTVNGTPVVVAQVAGAKGLITLQLPTQPTDLVLVSYFFHRGDTSFTDNLSSQVTTTNASLTSPGFEPFNITTGQNDQFIVLVAGVSSTVTLPQGALTTANIVSVLNASAIKNLQASVFTDNDGLNHLQLTAPQSLQIGGGSANGPLGWSTNTQTTRNTVFRVYQRPIVDGSGGGITTTDTSKVVVLVNNVQVIPASVDGTNGLVTLAFAPAPGSTVTVQYFANTWQNTFDYLPDSLVTTVLNCGISPARSDYIQNVDFVVSNPTADTSIVSWGVSDTISAGSTSAASTTPFNGTQITGLLVDAKMWLGTCSPVTNTTVIPAQVSTTQFILPEIPTTGNGRNSTLGPTLFATVTNGRQDLITNRPDLVTVYAGRGLRDALNRPAQTVIAVDGATATITLANALPPDWTCFATFYYNDIVDDTYILTCVTPGTVGAGQYTVTDSASGQLLYQVRFGTKTGISQTIQWPRGSETIPDACYSGAGTPVSETVTVTFSTEPAANAVFTNRNPEPYSLYAPSANWGQGVNGSSATTNLLAAAKGYLISTEVVLPSANTVTLPSVVPAGLFTLSASATVPTAVSQVGVLVPGSQIVFSIDVTSTVYTVLSVTGANVVLTTSYTGVTGPSEALTGGILNLLVDTVPVAVGLPIAVGSPTAIVAAINTAIDANAAFIGTAPNNLASFAQVGPSTGGVFFIVKSYTTPAALPGGFDALSGVAIAQGTVETYLGYTTFQSALGTPGAVNKPATLLGSIAGPFNITTGLNDQFIVLANGTFAAASPRTVTATAKTGFAFVNWTENGTEVSTSASYDFTLNASRELVANFTTQYYLTMSAGTGGSVSPGSRWYNGGTVVAISATANSGYSFSSWTGSGSGSYSGSSSSPTVTMNGPITEAASFTADPGNISVTVQASPSGRSFTVDGTPSTTSRTFSWVSGTSHTVATSSPQSGGPGVQYVWSGWSDGGAMSHTVSPTSGTTYTASFATQYRLDTGASPAGSGTVVLTPAGTWFSPGQAVQLTASAANGYAFSAWMGVDSASGGTASVTMNAYRNVTANFTAIPPVRAFTFITLAGSSIAGSQNGAGRAAQFNSEMGVASDNAGNVYVADTYNSTIRKISPDGVVTTLAGLAGRIGSANGVGSLARFFWPSGVAVDGGGTVYVADTYNSTIRKITPAGSVSTFAGAAGLVGFSDGPGGSARFNQPISVAVGGNGVLYVADAGNNSIRRVTPGGVVGTLAGWTNAGYADGVGTNALLNGPAGVGVDGLGNVFVADTGNDTIRKIETNGVVSTLAGLAGSAGSTDGAGADARFNGPAGLAADAAGNLFVADTYSYTIRRVATNGTVTTIAGAPGRYGYRDGAGTNALFELASGIAVDGSGNVYVADTDNNVIRKGWWSGALPEFVLHSPQFSGGQVQLDFRVRTGPSSGFTLQGAAQEVGPWIPDVTAELTTNVFGVSYSFTTWSGAPVQFYRVRSP